MITLRHYIGTSTLLFVILFAHILPTFAQNEPDFAWAKRIGNNTSPGVLDPVTAIDGQGNSYLAGGFTGQTFTIDGLSISSKYNNGFTNNHGYMAKYNPNGQIIWAKSMLNISLSFYSKNVNNNKLLVDGQGNIYLCGLYSFNTYRFSVLNDYYMTDTTTQSPISGTQYNMFLAKLDADGNVLWVRKTSHPDDYPEDLSHSNEIHFDLDGNINMTGGFLNSILFAPGSTLTNNTGEIGVFLTKYSPEGDVLQSKKLVGAAYPKNLFGTEQVKTDASGNLYRWSNRNANNPKRLYRYDAAGEFLDSLDVSINITVTTGLHGIKSNLNAFTVSPVGDVIIGGAYVGNITIGASSYNGSGNNNSDAVAFKLATPNYGIDWVKTYQTTNNDAFKQLLTDGVGNIYALGANASTGASRMLLQKYTGDGTLLWDLPLGTGSDVTPTSLCQSQKGGNIWVGGMFRNAANFGSGYQWTTPSNTHFNGFLVQYGLCNTANPVVITPATTILCGEEDITLSANLNDPSLTYLWNTPTGTVAIGSSATTAELTVTQPGKYYLVAQENAECYGNSQEIWVTKYPLPDVSVIQQAGTLVAAAGYTYQWLDCNNNHTPIGGANAVSFTPVQNGTYAVKVTSPEGCIDTSACFTINILSVNKININQFISIYPNPAKDEITIQSAVDIQSVRILDLQGKELLRENTDKVSISALPTGMYLIEITTPKGGGNKKFIKE